MGWCGGSVAGARELEITAHTLETAFTALTRDAADDERLRRDKGAHGGVVRSARRASGLPHLPREGRPVEQLADAVRRVHSGLRVVDPAPAEASLFEGANPLSTV